MKMTECTSCLDNLNSYNCLNYYDDDMKLFIFKYCIDCTTYLKSNLLKNIVYEIKKENCIKSLKRKLVSGLPQKLDENVDELFNRHKKISTLLIEDEECIKSINDNLFALSLKLESMDTNELNKSLDYILKEF